MLFATEPLLPVIHSLQRAFKSQRIIIKLASRSPVTTSLASSGALHQTTGWHMKQMQMQSQQP